MSRIGPLVEWWVYILLDNLVKYRTMSVGSQLWSMKFKCSSKSRLQSLAVTLNFEIWDITRLPLSEIISSWTHRDPCHQAAVDKSACMVIYNSIKAGNISWADSVSRRLHKKRSPAEESLLLSRERHPTWILNDLCLKFLHKWAVICPYSEQTHYVCK